MTKSNSTKKALVFALLSTLLCVSMLIGTTFAWFTDTASTAVNKIVSGNLDVKLEYATAWDETGKPTAWADAEGKTLNFRTADNNTNILWEPGCTYKLPELRVVNNGTLALKFKVVISGVDGNTGLMKVINFTMNGMELGTDISLAKGATSDMLAISAHMDEAAGNEYQNQEITGIGVTVYATQDTVESDSNGNTYDADAAYVENVSSAADLQEAMTAGKEYVKLTFDITIEDSMTFIGKISIDGDGNTIVMNKRNVFQDGANVTFRNCTVKVNAANTSIYNSTVEFAEDTVLDSSAPEYTAAIWAYGGATLIFRGKLISSVPNAYGICVNTNAMTNKAPNTVELIGADITTNGGATVYVNGSVGGHTLKIADCKITNTDPAGQALYISNSATAEKQHVTIENCEISGGTAIEVKHTDLTIKNSTLTATGDPTQYEENNNGATAIGYCLATTSNSKNGVIDPTTGTITIENCTFVSTVSGCEVFNSFATAEGNAGAVINGYDQTKVLYPAKLTPNA